MTVLTKSKYLIGLECPRFLWRMFHDPESIRKPTIAEEFRFKQGDEVGELAKKLFPEGINIPIDYKENIIKSKELLKKKKPLFEAGFEYNNCFSRADILVPNKGKWDIIEVKSGTKVKDINIHDVSFQKYVYKNNGIKIGKCFILHLNNEYIRKGKIDIDKIFIKEDITKEVNEIKNVEESIKYIFDTISMDKPPKANLTKKIFKDGNHECFLENCVELPENNVFCLYRGGKLSCELFDNGIKTIKDIPSNVKLNDKQGIQRDCEIKGKIHVHKESIKHFLKTLHYPIYYLDFETFSTAVPMFDGLKPYSQVPFQFSLHIVKKEGCKPEHYPFLYEGNKDPREDFIIALEKVIGDKGSIVVYNQAFELGRLKELGNYFPKYKNFIENLLTRVIDLLVPFRNFSYYNPKQEGSASIKKVLPALTDKSYKGMEISDGGTASVEFYNMAYKNGNNVRESLLKYCELDTLAEVMIVEKLNWLVE